MTNYQILEIAIDIGFFLTIVSITVIFAILREKSIRKSLAGRATNEGRDFNRVLSEAASTVPSVDDLDIESRPRRRPVDGTRASHKPVPVAASTSGLSRAEQEFLKNIAVE